MEIKKYWVLAKLSFQQQLIYRGNILMYRFGEFASTLILILIWVVVYTQRDMLEGYTLAEMITYSAGIGIIDALSRTWISDSIERDVHKGRLSSLLLKPLNYFRYRFIFDFSRKQISSWFSILTYFVIILILRRYFVLNVDIVRWALFFVSVIGVVLLRFLLSFFIGLLSFWFIQIGGFVYTFGVLLRIMTGSYMPLELFPKLFGRVVGFLPFAYMQYFSMQIYLGKISVLEAAKGLGTQLFWMVVLFCLVKLVWKKALRRYESVGM